MWKSEEGRNLGRRGEGEKNGRAGLGMGVNRRGVQSARRKNGNIQQ